MGEKWDDVLADPVRLLAADRAEVRKHLDGPVGGGGGVGREVFLQAEAVFGAAEVSVAEWASWLHFAARATGHDEYAERIAAAEPGMPWRTVWAWWRPANWFPIHPSLNGDYYRIDRRLYEGRALIEVTDDMRGPLWLDAETGRRVSVRDEEALAEAPWSPEALDAPKVRDWSLTAPESWEGAVPIAVVEGRTRHLVENAHGLALLETDPEVLKDWPRGDGIDPSSADDIPPGPEPDRRRPTGPLTPARVDDAFGTRHVLRIPEADLPEGLEHPESRRHLRDIGVPAWWACHSGEYETHAPEAMRPPADGTLSGNGESEDLIAFGSCDYGDVYLHRLHGSLHIWSRLDGRTNRTFVPLAPSLDVFTRVLEAIHRYSNACWHPYPIEGEQEDVTRLFLEELDELAPGVFDRKTASGEIWSWLYAGITELGVDGF
ncbi:SUKH-4 family immunity protein [Streptomyces sp. NPDC002643]